MRAYKSGLPRDRASWAFVLAAPLASLAVSCSGGDGAERHTACFQPKGSAVLCYESISEPASLVDKTKGSPGIALRFFGRASGRDIPIYVVAGGPAYPDSWIDEVGLPHCYQQMVDFANVVQCIREEQVGAEQERVRDFAAKELSFWINKVKPEQTISDECRAIGIDGMVAAREAET